MNELQLRGTIIQVLPIESGVSKSSGKEWKKQSYILETKEQYPRKVKYDVFGDTRIEECAAQINDEVIVSIDIESREFNGKYFTNINAYKVEIDLGDVQPANQPQQESVQVAADLAQDADGAENDNLPF
jgi:hypothetical protein